LCGVLSWRGASATSGPAAGFTQDSTSSGIANLL
jgi:hypothetical protein